jgi:hypothetical protein
MKKKPLKTKTGPVAFAPTSDDRQDVMLMVAAGMSLELIADAMDVSRRTLSRLFVRELSIGRAKKMLANLKRLEDAAESGNVSAQKYLHTLMNNHGDKPEAEADDPWATLADKIQDEIDAQANLPKNSEFQGTVN